MKKEGAVSITVRLSDADLADLKRISPAIGLSVNHLIRESVSRYLAEFRRLEIDKAFEGMADDVEYIRITHLIMEELQHVDAEVEG